MHLFTLYSTSLKCLITLGYSHWSTFCAFGLCGLTNAVLSTYSGLPWMLNEKEKLSFLEQCFQGVGFWSVKGVVLFLHSNRQPFRATFPSQSLFWCYNEQSTGSTEECKGIFFFLIVVFFFFYSILSISIPSPHTYEYLESFVTFLFVLFIFLFLPTYLMGCLLVQNMSHMCTAAHSALRFLFVTHTRTHSADSVVFWCH